MKHSLAFSSVSGGGRSLLPHGAADGEARDRVFFGMIDDTRLPAAWRIHPAGLKDGSRGLSAVTPPVPGGNRPHPGGGEAFGARRQSLLLTRIICGSTGPAPGRGLRRDGAGSNPVRGGLFIAAAPPTPSSFSLFFSGAAGREVNRRSSPAPLKNKEKEVWPPGSSIDRPPLRGFLALGAENPFKQQPIRNRDALCLPFPSGRGLAFIASDLHLDPGPRFRQGFASDPNRLHTPIRFSGP